MNRLELGAAIGLVSLTVGQTVSLYTNAAPSINDLRNSPVTREKRQGLLDADFMSGIGVVLIGGTVSVLTMSPLPLLLGILAWVAMSYCHRSILNSAPSQ